MKTDFIFNKLSKLINNIIPNSSGQDQLKDHFTPHFALTMFMLSFCNYAGLLIVLFAVYKEFYEDGHWKDFFSRTESGEDGRIDLLFRIMGSLIAYLTTLY